MRSCLFLPPSYELLTLMTALRAVRFFPFSASTIGICAGLMLELASSVPPKAATKRKTVAGIKASRHIRRPKIPDRGEEADLFMVDGFSRAGPLMQWPIVSSRGVLFFYSAAHWNSRHYTAAPQRAFPNGTADLRLRCPEGSPLLFRHASQTVERWNLCRLSRDWGIRYAGCTNFMALYYSSILDPGDSVLHNTSSRRTGKLRESRWSRSP